MLQHLGLPSRVPTPSAMFRIGSLTTFEVTLSEELKARLEGAGYYSRFPMMVAPHRGPPRLGWLGN